MAKRVMVSDDQAQQMMAGSGKPTKAKKKRRSEIHDTPDEIGLEDKLTDKIAGVPLKKQEPEHDSKVSAGALRGIMSETIARVYEEMWPGMNVRIADEPNDEMKEEAYILSLTMIVGNATDLPRRGLKIRDTEMTMHDSLCKRCAA